MFQNFETVNYRAFFNNLEDLYFIVVEHIVKLNIDL